MALNFKTLSVRALSALVFVLLLMGCVYWNYISFSAFFFVVSIMGLNEFYKIAGQMGVKPVKAVGFIMGLLTYISFLQIDNLISDPASIIIIQNILRPLLSILIVMPFIIFAIALFSRKENAIQSAMFTIGGIIYAVLPFALLNRTVFYENGCDGSYFEPMLLLGVIFLIWCNDTFAYLGGSLFGKNKMIERVSPGKTWEGTIMGILITFGASFTFNYWVFNLGDFTWPLLGVLVPILATVGDLIESKLKREAGVKDSGNIMPGHGGILDRFDSLIFVSPFVFVFFKL